MSISSLSKYLLPGTQLDWLAPILSFYLSLPFLIPGGLSVVFLYLPGFQDRASCVKTFPA